MKKIVFSAIAVAITFSALAQRKCGTLEHEEFLNKQNPNRANERAAFEKKIQKYLATDANAKTAQVLVRIPLVVHMVYSSATDSISDAQIFSQIQILNDDYTRKNADTVNTPIPFRSVASSPQINYCWAQRDPLGNPTTGIERRKSTTTSWTTDDAVKSFSTGGLDAWDPSRYFNIWVCNLGGGLLGYGEFPAGTLSNTYGYVSGYFCFGNIGKVTPPYDKGRTGTHEIGHCFNLYHTFQGGCANADLCPDTPAEAVALYGCPVYPKTDACTTTAPGVMFMNYMDYTDDACMNIFTANQSTRMVAIINNPPYNSLTTSNACTPVVLMANDAGNTAVNSPAGTICATTFIPNVTLKNWGTSVLTSVTINYKIDNGTVQTSNWTGSLASLATATVSMPAMTSTVGTHTFTAYTTNPNAGIDQNTSNDTTRNTFIIAPAVGQTIPYVEGFESTTFPSNGITIKNPDAGITWARTTAAFKSGVASAFMDNANYNASKQIDEMVLPNLNLTVTNPQMTFQVAYQLYTAPTATPPFSDTLAVLLSTNCGSTWTQLYKKFSTALTTATPAFSTTTFTPTASQWRMETISLNAYAANNKVIIKFRNITDYENQLYIDDINISSSTGIKTDAASTGIFIYPNPSADGKFMVDIKKDENDVNKLSVYDVLGNKVYEINQKIPVGSYNMDLSNLSNGTYFVEVIKDNKPVFTKIVINK